MSTLSEKRTDGSLDTAVQGAHFDDRIEDAVLKVHGCPIHIIDRFMDSGRDVTVHALKIVNP